jgi:hypothetical protein
LFREECLVGGEWVAAAGRKSICVRNPSTNASIGHVPNMGTTETKQAIDQANEALAAWRAKAAKERSAILLAIAQRMIPVRIRQGTPAYDIVSSRRRFLRLKPRRASQAARTFFPIKREAVGNDSGPGGAEASAAP